MRKVLLLINDPDRAALMIRILKECGYDPLKCAGFENLRELTEKAEMTFVLAETRWYTKSIFSIMKSLPLNRVHSSPRWLLLKGHEQDDHRQSLRAQGVVAVLPSSVTETELKEAFEHAERCLADPLYEIMDCLEHITGVQLKSEKRSLVETRLRRRVDALQLKSFSDYCRYFLENRETEIPHAISLITTHTTEFFREDQHFDYLCDHIYPRLEGRDKISLWSAAASTGQEVYSIAISFFEYRRARNQPMPADLDFRVYGTDIDHSSLQTAKEGIYKKEQVRHLAPALVKRYFDEGTGELAEYVRIKEFVHRVCHFSPLNLLTDSFSLKEIDFIFLRNALIYFKPDDVRSIINRLAPTLKSDGYLFLGHSESLVGLNTPFKKRGNSIYSLEGTTVSESRSLEELDSLILIGASTGGVEALKVVLEGIPPGCPPILIVQHIPGTFSKALAKRLNETCQISVSEAQDGEKLEMSHAYIAPGGKQMRLIQMSQNLYIEINDDPPLGSHKPSVDYLFHSVVPSTKKRRVVAALLTGMGRDGAIGMQKLRQAGAHTIAQDEATSVVYGMPKAAVDLNAAGEILPLPQIASHLIRALKKRRAA